MITVVGYHGYLKPKEAAKMNSIATVVKERVEWEFEGSVSDFAEKWGEKFLYWPECNTTHLPCIFVTSFPSFGTYG